MLLPILLGGGGGFLLFYKLMKGPQHWKWGSNKVLFFFLLVRELSSFSHSKLFAHWRLLGLIDLTRRSRRTGAANDFFLL